MSRRVAGFKGEYLWEFDIAEWQLLALAQAFPADRYSWRPAESARPASEVLVHIAAGNLALLRLAGIEAAPDLYGELESETLPRMRAMIETNFALEKRITDKAEVLALMTRSFEAVRTSFTEAPDEVLDRTETFFGEQTSIRRLYMRLLTHMHEHMGQLIAYTRAMGLQAPWPDWRESSKEELKRSQTA